MYQGDILKIAGKGNSRKFTLVIKIINSEETVTNTRIAEVDKNGTWKLLEPISIPFDAIFGEYTVIISDTVSDGGNQISKKVEC